MSAIGGTLIMHPMVPQAGAVRAPARPPIVAIPTVVRPAVNLATVNVASLHLLNPQVIGFGAIAPGQPRASFRLPTLISPTIAPTEGTLFEDPQDQTKKHYLPRYDLATKPGASRLLKSVVLKPSQNNCELVVDLIDITAPAVANGHIRQDASTRYFVTANIQGVVMTWDLTVRSTSSNAIELGLLLPRPGDVDKVYYAMTEPAAQSKLIIRRSLGVALPLPATSRPVPGPPAAVASSPRPFLHPMPRPAPVNSQPLYRPSTVTIDSSIPFTFSKDLDKNVFEQLEGPPSGPAGYIKRDLVWDKNEKGENSTYTYYLDSNYGQYGSQPCPFYFFPDIFKIARQSAPPHAPELLLSTNGEDINSVTLTLSYVACPVWDPRRTEAAALQLKEMFALNVVPVPTLFQGSELKLLLNLPSNDPGQAPSLVPQTGAMVDLTAGIKGAVTLKLAQFQQIYDALFDDVSPLLSGRVEVTIAGEVHNIEFKARATDFVGTVFDLKTNIDTQRNALVANLQNAIESSVHVDRLPVALVSNGITDPGCTVQISPSLPVDLPPGKAGSPASTGGNITIVLQRSSNKPLDSSCLPLFDFTDTAVVPDPKAIWQAIMSNQVVGPISRSITFKLVASLLTSAVASTPPPAAAASATSISTSSTSAPAVSVDEIIAIQVVFEDGQTLGFDPSIAPDSAGFINQKIALAVPIEAYVLKEGSSDTYRYRVDLISPHDIKHGDWVTDNRDMVFLSVG